MSRNIKPFALFVVTFTLKENARPASRPPELATVEEALKMRRPLCQRGVLSSWRKSCATLYAEARLGSVVVRLRGLAHVAQPFGHRLQGVVEDKDADDQLL